MYIREAAFEDCGLLASIVLPTGLTLIEANAFANDASLKTVSIPTTVTEIASSSFSYPKKLTIKGIEGSYAQEYADSRGITFEDLGEVPVESIEFQNKEFKWLRNSEHSTSSLIITPVNYTDTLIWTSSNEDIVKVTSDGTLRTSYWNTGTATITVTAGTKSATCVVTVYDPDAVEDDNNGDNNGDDIGNDDDTEDNTKNIEVTEDSIYQITENADLEESNGTSLTITGVQTNTTVEECIKNFGDSDEISIVDKNGNEVEADAKVGTGFEVQKKADGIVIQVAVIIIKGDTDGTGTIDVLDMEAIQKSILGISKLIGAYKSAAIISGGETDISVLDMEAVQKDILGIAKIK
jgi:hypothetical protein